MPARAEVVVAESVTALGPEARDAVLVAGSHAGIIAAYLGASAGARALILNDAGIGKDEAGVAGLAYLDAIGIAAASVSHMSARIGDGRDALDRGVISRANAVARALGVIPGMPVRAAAQCLRVAPLRHADPPPYADGRFALDTSAPPHVWGLDSIGKLVRGEDAGRILVIASHGALHGGRPQSALPVAAAGAVFHDAGIGVDRVGVSRLAVLDARGMPAAAVAGASARIGDARSLWDSGVLSVVNDAAARHGIGAGMSVRAFASTLRAAARNLTKR